MSDLTSQPPSRPSSTDTAASSMPADKVPADEGSKLRTFLSILKKFLGVADLAAVRFSLPAQLLEPRPNLEYWTYFDRPETFAAIGDSDDDLGRMLAALRFWFTKDLKYVKGKPCKPYNTTLGEFFRCSWTVKDNLPVVVDEQGRPQKQEAGDTQKGGADGKDVKVIFLTEQTSHHPPVSAWYAECAEKGISARGFDQLSAKFTGTSIRVVPGAHNLGIFVTLAHRDGEEYQMTHPAAYLGGLLRGNLSVSVADQCIIACPKTKLKVVLHYMDEGWLGKAQNRMNGAIYRYDPETDKITDLKKVPEKDVIMRLEGAWTDKIYFTLAGEKEKHLLIDLNPLMPLSKAVPPEEQQLSNESLRFWSAVTNAIKSKQFGEANKLKQEIEERQRQKAKEREEGQEEWHPRFFTGATTPAGRPELTDDGKAAIDGLVKDNLSLPESTVAGA